MLMKELTQSYPFLVIHYQMLVSRLSSLSGHLYNLSLRATDDRVHTPLAWPGGDTWQQLKMLMKELTQSYPFLAVHYLMLVRRLSSLSGHLYYLLLRAADNRVHMPLAWPGGGIR